MARYGRTGRGGEDRDRGDRGTRRRIPQGFTETGRMAMDDRRGVSASTDNPKNIEIYEQALRALNVYRGDPVAIIDTALAADPDFVMGHVLKAQLMITMWERSLLPKIEASLARLKDLDNRSNARERAHVGAIALWAAGDWNGARAALDRLLVEHPRDLLALQVG